jgi:hypothetical protein
MLLLLQVEARYALAVGRESSDKLAEALANKAEVRQCICICADVDGYRCQSDTAMQGKRWQAVKRVAGFRALLQNKMQQM